MAQGLKEAEKALAELRYRFDNEPLRTRPLTSEILDAENLVRYYKQLETPRISVPRRHKGRNRYDLD